MTDGSGVMAEATYRQAALELNAAIRDALRWIALDAESSVAHAALEKVHREWDPVLRRLEA